MEEKIGLNKKIERGVIAMKGRKAWGKEYEYEDGKVTAYGWIDPVDAEISNPEYCKQPTDLTYGGSHYFPELQTARLVFIERKTEITLLEDVPPT